MLTSKKELFEFDQSVELTFSYKGKNSISLRTLENEIHFKSLERTAIAIIDREISMILELKVKISNSFRNSIVFSIYSNNKTFVSSYISIFESLWRYIDLLEKFKEIDKRH